MKISKQKRRYDAMRAWLTPEDDIEKCMTTLPVNNGTFDFRACNREMKITTIFGLNLITHKSNSIFLNYQHLHDEVHYLYNNTFYLVYLVASPVLGININCTAPYLGCRRNGRRHLS